MRFSRMPALSLANSLSQRRAPDDLDHVPAGAAEDALELLDDLAVAAHRAVESLQVAVDDEDQVVEGFAASQRNRAERLRLVAFAVAEERPDLATFGLREPAAFEIFEEPRLVDRRQRSQTHGHRRELPELGHQPRMRIRGYALAFAFLPKIDQLLIGESTLDEGASHRSPARRGPAHRSGRRRDRLIAPRQKWPKPMSYSSADDWKLAMWPPSSEDSLFARRMIAMAFQRIADRILCSISRLPEDFSSCPGGMVLR